jgi:hypothetical protein
MNAGLCDNARAIILPQIAKDNAMASKTTRNTSMMLHLDRSFSIRVESTVGVRFGNKPVQSIHKMINVTIRELQCCNEVMLL